MDLESLNAIRDNLARLPEKSVILYPLVLENSLELVLVTPDSPPIHRTVAVKKENLHQTILNFRKALENPSLDVKKPARQLYDWLIKPIEKDLTQAATQTIVYAPDGQLRYIPLAALIVCRLLTWAIDFKLTPTSQYVIFDGRAFVRTT